MSLTVAQAASALAVGEVIAFPTDTVYGLAVRPGHEQRVYEIKRRPLGMPLILMVASAGDAEGHVQVEERARRYMQRWWPGPLTLVLPRGDGAGTLGVRVPAHPLALELLTAAGPLLTTSANVHGAPDALTAAEAAVLPGIAGVLDGGPVPGGVPSSVLDLTAGQPRLLREGAVPADELVGPGWER